MRNNVTKDSDTSQDLPLDERMAIFDAFPPAIRAAYKGAKEDYSILQVHLCLERKLNTVDEIVAALNS